MKALVINCSPVRNGATAEICKIISEYLESRADVKSICIDDFKFNFCKGCRVCHQSARCVQHDDIEKIMENFEWADCIISISPSYWADIPGQFKAFIDRCTPWCNTHDPHAVLNGKKRGFAVVLRTGPNIKECYRVMSSIEHFYGHLEIEWGGGIGFCSIENQEAVASRKNEILEFAATL